MKNDLQDVLSNGGFTIKPLDIGLVKSLEDEMKKLFGQQNVDNNEFLGSLNACTDDRIAQLLIFLIAVEIFCQDTTLFKVTM